MNVTTDILIWLIICVLLKVLSSQNTEYTKETDSEIIRKNLGVESVELRDGKTELLFTASGKSRENIYVAVSKWGFLFNVHTPTTDAFEVLGSLTLIATDAEGNERKASLNWKGDTTFINVFDGVDQVGSGNKTTCITSIKWNQDGSVMAEKRETGHKILYLTPLDEDINKLDKEKGLLRLRFAWQVKKPFLLTFDSDVTILKSITLATTTDYPTTDTVANADANGSNVTYLIIIIVVIALVICIIILAGIAFYCYKKRRIEVSGTKSKSNSKVPAKAIKHVVEKKESSSAVSSQEDPNTTYGFKTPRTVQSSEMFTDKSVKVTFKRPLVVPLKELRSSDGIGSLNNSLQTAQPFVPFSNNIDELRHPKSNENSTKTALNIEKGKNKVDFVAPKMETSTKVVASASTRSATGTVTGTVKDTATLKTAVADDVKTAQLVVVAAEKDKGKVNDKNKK